MEQQIKLEVNSFKLYARNMYTETYLESGHRVRVCERVVEVLEGELIIGEYNCVYTCDDIMHQVYTNSSVKKHTETVIVEQAVGSIGDSDSCNGYLARVRVLEKNTYYDPRCSEPVESSSVTLVDCI